MKEFSLIVQENKFSSIMTEMSAGEHETHLKIQNMLIMVVDSSVINDRIKVLQILYFVITTFYVL
jgi:hypothetical protein